MKRGTFARCQNGHLGVITRHGRSSEVITESGDYGDIWEGIYIEDTANHKIGDRWLSVRPTPEKLVSSVGAGTYDYMFKPGKPLGYPEPEEDDS